MTTRPRVLRILRIVAAVLLAGATALAADGRKFFSGYAGALPAREEDGARTYFDKPAVRALLARLETGSLTSAESDRSLEGSGASTADLLRVGILRRDGERVAIGFAYFTAADMKKIYAVVDRVAPALAGAYRRRGKDFARIFDAYPARTVPRGQIEFVLLAGFCLNWDGLEMTQRLGYRRPVWVEGPGFRYSFWASEDVPGRDYREVYWGSSTFPGRSKGATDAAAYSFSSFGDADSDPRMNFPDLPYLPAADLAPKVRACAERVGLRDVDEMGQHFEKVLGGETLAAVSRALFALRRRPLSAARLETLLGRNAKPLMDLLEEIDYVERDGGGLYRLRVPVFDEPDRAMIDRTIALSREILASWLKENSGEIRRDLSDLTAARAGLPFEALFTQIWHEIFGAVTRDLARSGDVASAYGPGVRYKGSFSVLWRQSLYSFFPG